MNKNRILTMLTIGALVVILCACGKEANMTSDGLVPENSVSQEKVTSVEEQSENPTTKGQNKVTLSDVEAEINGRFNLKWLNSKELSVGVIYDSNYDSVHVLFDSEGVVHYITEDNIQSGFYDGMCKYSQQEMMDETGRPFRPRFLQEDEEIVRYAKDDFGVVLWTAKKIDSLDGSKTILTAWTSTGTMLAQFDSSQEAFEEISASSLYDALFENQHFIYQGGYTYLIVCRSQYYFLNLDTKQVHCIRSDGGYPSIQSDGAYKLKCTKSGNMWYTQLMDKEWNILPEWENMTYRGPGSPIMNEGLIYLDGHINEPNGPHYPSGFYDPSLNCIIDLTQYDVQPISNYELSPRFINGYTVLQLENSDHVPFWGVMSKDGAWMFEPRIGVVNSYVPFKDGLLVNIEAEKDSKIYRTFTETGESLGEKWDSISFELSSGENSFEYGRTPYETDKNYLYLVLIDYKDYSEHIIKVNPDESFTYLN